MLDMPPTPLPAKPRPNPPYPKNSILAQQEADTLRALEAKEQLPVAGAEAATHDMKADLMAAGVKAAEGDAEPLDATMSETASRPLRNAVTAGSSLGLPGMLGGGAPDLRD
jgi:hypothetical protein